MTIASIKFEIRAPDYMWIDCLYTCLAPEWGNEKLHEYENVHLHVHVFAISALARAGMSVIVTVIFEIIF